MFDPGQLVDVDRYSDYAPIVGKRLRAVRWQRQLSLQAVSAAAAQEFRASALAADERGERAISVPRLQRLARLYGVPVEQPSHRRNRPGRPEATSDRGRRGGDDRP